MLAQTLLQKDGVYLAVLDLVPSFNKVLSDIKNHRPCECHVDLKWSCKRISTLVIDMSYILPRHSSGFKNRKLVAKIVIYLLEIEYS